MNLLVKYLKKYWQLCLLALFLAAINQTFSLLDPLIMRRIIDHYVTPRASLTEKVFVNGVIGLILLGMGFAMVSRIAKNFQDYFLNVINCKINFIWANLVKNFKHIMKLFFNNNIKYVFIVIISN